MQVLRTGTSGLHASAQAHTRVPAGHPEGYIEAFANIYRNFAKCVQARIEGHEPDPVHLDFPGVTDGVRGMRFVECVVESNTAQMKWIPM